MWTPTEGYLGAVPIRLVDHHAGPHSTVAGIEAVLTATATGTVISTTCIEQLNATFRAHLAPLARRGRAITRTESALTAGV